MEPMFSCADYTFPLLAHEKVLDLIALLDFTAVDIGFFQDRSHLQPGAVLGDPAGQAKKLKSLLKLRGLRPSDLFLQTALDFRSSAANNPDAALREKAFQWFERTLDFAVLIGAPHVTVLPGASFEEWGAEASWELCVQEMSRRVDLARGYGLDLSIEPHIGSIVDTPEAVLDLLKAVEGLTLALDYTHFVKTGIEQKRIEPLIPFAKVLHARGGCPGKAQAAMKENTIDYARIAELLLQNAFSGSICLEFVWNEWEGMNQVDTISETILLRKVIAEAFDRLKT